MNNLLSGILTLLFLLSPLTSHARFTQADTWPGKEMAPITLNKYSYVNNDPANLIDPSGHVSIASVMSAINIRAINTTAAQASYRVSVKKIGRELSCIAIEELVSDVIMQKLTGGVYVLLDGKDYYVGRTNDFERRYLEHVNDTRKSIQKTLARFHMDGDVNDLRVIEQFFMELFNEAKKPLSNTNNSIAAKPASTNSRRLRKIVDKLDLCK